MRNGHRLSRALPAVSCASTRSRSTRIGSGSASGSAAVVRRGKLSDSKHRHVLFRQSLSKSIRFTTTSNDQLEFELRSEIERATNFSFAVCQHHDRHASINNRNQGRERSISFGPTRAAWSTFVDRHRIAITLRVKHHLSQRRKHAHQRSRISTAQRRETNVHRDGRTHDHLLRCFTRKIDQRRLAHPDP